MVADFHLDIYLDKVPTDADPPDGLPRGKIKEAKDMGCIIETAKFGQHLDVKRSKAWAELGDE